MSSAFWDNSIAFSNDSKTFPTLHVRGESNKFKGKREKVRDTSCHECWMSVCVCVRVCASVNSALWMYWCSSSTIISKSEEIIWILHFLYLCWCWPCLRFECYSKKNWRSHFLLFPTFSIFSSLLCITAGYTGVGIRCHFPFATSYPSIACRPFCRASILWSMLLIRVDIFVTAVGVVLLLKVTFLIIFFAFYFSLALHSHLMEILSSGNLTEPYHLFLIINGKRIV